MQSVRIASFDRHGLGPAVGESGHPWNRQPDIQRVLSRHLPPLTASMFAKPVLAADSDRVDWYSDLAGQPVPLRTLSDDEQQGIRERLADRLASVCALAEQMPRIAPDDAEAGPLLISAARYPGDDYVYVIDGEPVLTFWGYAGTDIADAIASETPGPGRLTRVLPRWVLPLGIGVLFTSIGIGGWLWWEHQREQTLLAALDTALEAQCEPATPLLLLLRRLDEIDPDRSRYPDIQRGARAEQALCSEAADLARRLAQSRGDCGRLAELTDELLLYDLSRAPMQGIKAALDVENALCEKAAGLADRLGAVRGDCAAVDALDAELGPQDSEPLKGVRGDLDEALALCRTAADISARLAASIDDCPQLRRLDGAMDGYNRSREPLAGVDQGLQQALDHCELAEGFTRRLEQSQVDCLALAGLGQALDAHRMEQGPLVSVRRRLDVALEQCRALGELEQRFADSQGHCEAMRQLQGGLEQYRSNLRFQEIRMRLNRELQLCEQASVLEQRLETAGTDCARLRALAPELEGADDPRFAAFARRLQRALKRCDAVALFGGRLAAAGHDCKQLKAVELDLKRVGGDHLKAIRGRLRKALVPCRPKPKPPSVARRVPEGAAAHAMTGACSGSLVLSPAAGHDGDPGYHIVTIDPPVSSKVARVESDNPGCRNCDLPKVGRNTWKRKLYFSGGGGPVSVRYTAYDAAGKALCRGQGTARVLRR